MSTMVRAKTKIKKVLPEFFTNSAENFLKNDTTYKLSKNKNGVVLDGGGYNRIEFNWKPGGEGFDIRYDTEYKTEAEKTISQLSNHYIASLTAQIASQQGFELEKFNSDSGAIQLTMKKF